MPMSSDTLEPGAVRDQLLSADGVVEVRDTDGRRVGRFLPDHVTHPERNIREAELLRRAADTTPGRTPDEVLARLRAIS
jgi:hypothetical protein